jgi:ribonucleoside-diphosphate reductase beta chain
LASVFKPSNHDATKEPMFLGREVSVARYDKQKYPFLEKLTQKQISFFWVPEEVDLSKDRIDFKDLDENEQHIFLSNLKYQILLDSVQGRAPNLAFLPICSLPELETFIETWSFYETIHSRSYTHIIRSVLNDPSGTFDSIVGIDEIVERATAITKYYDTLIDLVNKRAAGLEVDVYQLKKALYLCLASVNVLEGIRFYVSFACSFSFAERKIMEGNAKIIKFIARDEAVHLSATQFMLNNLKHEDKDFHKISVECEPQVREIFREAANQEIDWANYLFKDGSMMGMNKTILEQYVMHLTNTRMKALNLRPIFEETANPIPWMNNWLQSDNVQVAPQETEISSYLTGAIDNTVEDNSFDDFGDL